MSLYNILPSPSKEISYAYWTGLFNENELQSITNFGEALTKNNAAIMNNIVDEKIRKNDISWISHNEYTNFIYDKLAWVIRQLNSQFFQFDITHFVDDLQYTCYENINDHYDWHLDSGDTIAPRKLSLSLQLSDPSEYEGGELQFMIGNIPVIAEKTRGMIYVFPSYILHKVTPITKGCRKSLVAWACRSKV